MTFFIQEVHEELIRLLICIIKYEILIVLFNYGKLTYLLYHGYCGQTIGPTIRSTVTQVWVHLSHENGQT